MDHRQVAKRRDHQILGLYFLIELDPSRVFVVLRLYLLHCLTLRYFSHEIELLFRDSRLKLNSKLDLGVGLDQPFIGGYDQYALRQLEPLLERRLELGLLRHVTVEASDDAYVEIDPKGAIIRQKNLPHILFPHQSLLELHSLNLLQVLIQNQLVIFNHICADVYCFIYTMALDFHFEQFPDRLEFICFECYYDFFLAARFYAQLLGSDLEVCIVQGLKSDLSGL